MSEGTAYAATSTVSLTVFVSTCAQFEFAIALNVFLYGCVRSLVRSYAVISAAWCAVTLSSQQPTTGLTTVRSDAHTADTCRRCRSGSGSGVCKGTNSQTGKWQPLLKLHQQTVEGKRAKSLQDSLAPAWRTGSTHLPFTFLGGLWSDRYHLVQTGPVPGKQSLGRPLASAPSRRMVSSVRGLSTTCLL